MPQNATIGNTNGMASRQNSGQQKAGIALSVGWPTERWVAVIVLSALGLLILIRYGFKGLGFQGSVGGRVSV